LVIKLIYTRKSTLFHTWSWRRSH